MPVETSDIDVRIRLRDARQFREGMRKVSDSVKGLGRRGGDALQRFAQQGEQLKSMGRSMTMGLTLPIVGAGAASVKAAMDWESAFAGVRKTVDATEPQFGVLEEGIRGMSREIPVSANELAGIAEAAGQLGIESDNILGFTRTIADLGEATNLTGEEGATQLARFANITGMSQKNFDRLGSTIVDLGNNLATTEAEITQMGLRLAGAGSQVGMSEAQILSLSGAMSSVGIQAEAGGTAMSQAMLAMNSAVLGGGEDLKEFAKVAGLSGKDFKKAFETDPAGAITSFIDGLSRIKQGGGDVNAALDDLGLGGARMVRMFLSLSGAGDLLRDSLKRGDDAWKDNTALAKEAEERYGTFESQIGMLKNTVRDLGVIVGTTLLPPILAVADVATPVILGMAEGFESLPGPVQAGAIGLLALVAVLGPAVWMLGSLATAIGTVTKVMGLLNLAFLTSPVFWIAAAVIALVAGFIWAYHNIDWFREGVDAAFDAIVDGLDWVVTAAGDAWDFIAGGIDWLLGFVSKHWPKLLVLFGGPLGALVVLVVKNFNWIKNAAVDVWEWVRTAFGNIVGFIRELPGKISGAASGMWDGIKDAFRSVLDWLREKFDWIVNKVDGIKDGFEDLMPGPLGDIAGAAGDVGGLFADGFGLTGAQADGGPIHTTGAYLVGERGPEIVKLRAGQEVIPNHKINLSERMAQAAREIIVKSELHVGPEVLARATASAVADAEARR